MDPPTSKRSFSNNASTTQAGVEDREGSVTPICNYRTALGDIGDTSSNNQQAPNMPGKAILKTPAEPFDYEDFRARFDAAMEEQMARDRQLLGEYKRLFTTYQAWASVIGKWDEQVDRERQEDGISKLMEKERKLEQYRGKSLAVLNAVESAFQEMEDSESRLTAFPIYPHKAAAAATTVSSLPQYSISSQPFTSSSLLYKKANKKGKSKIPSEDEYDDDEDEDEPSSKKSKSVKEASAEGAFDFDEHFKKLTEQINKTLVKLKEDLSKLRASGAGGSGTLASSIENIQITIDKHKGENVPLKDLAHVVPKGGRQLVVNVFEADNVKKVISAIQLQNLNLQPVQDPKNALQLSIPLPPPTKEARIATAEQAGKIGDTAMSALRLARQSSHKKIKGLDKKQARPDDVRKADGKLDKMVKEANEEAKKLVEATKKAILEA